MKMARRSLSDIILGWCVGRPVLAMVIYIMLMFIFWAGMVTLAGYLFYTGMVWAGLTL